MKKIILLCSLLFTSTFISAIIIAPDQGLTPLMKACRSGKLPVVKKLIKEGADVNATSSVYHRTALIYAVNGSIHGASIVEYLLKNDAKLEITDTSFNTALLSCLSNYPLYHYGKNAEKLVNSRRKAAWLLLKAGAKIKVYNIRGLTPLLAASSWMGPEFIAELLKQDANIEARAEYDGNTPLINALSSNNIKVVELLLKHGAAPNARNYRNNIPLFFAKSPEAVKLLLEKGAKPTTKLFMRNWARWGDLNLLKIAIKENFPVTDKILINAAKNSSNPEVFPFLLKHYSADKKPPLDELLNNAVESQYKDISGIKTLLEKGANPNKTNKWGMTPLSVACHKKNLEVVELLLKHGAKLNIVDKQGKTPLMWLMWRSGPVEIAKTLIAYGANINKKDKQGRTALLTLMASSQYCNDKALQLLELLIKHKADLNVKDKNNASALLLALGHQQLPTTIKRLLELNVSVNTASKNNVSPLMLAARHYDAKIVKLLLERGAKVNAADDTGWTPLMYAAEYWPLSGGCIMYPIPRRRSRKAPQETIKILLKHGAKADIIDKSGNTPLIEAARWADADTLKLLIKNGKKDFVNVRDARGRSALMRAMYDTPEIKVVKALLTAGAKCEIKMNQNKFYRRINSNVKDGLVYSKEIIRTSVNQILPPLFRAVSRGKKDIVKIMLEHNANPNWQYQRRKEERPIYSMTYCRDPEIATLLIKAGAKGKEFKPPYYYTNKRASKGALSSAENAKIVDTLVKNIANNKRRKKSLSSLQYIFKRKWEYENIWRRPEIVEALLKNGANPRENNKHGNVLFWAFHVRYNGPDIMSIKILLKYGADVNVKNSKGKTLLGLAVKKNKCYLTDILLDAGADPRQVKDISKARPYIRRKIKQALLKKNDSVKE